MGQNFTPWIILKSFMYLKFWIRFFKPQGAQAQETWLVVEPTPLKHISQNGNLPQVGVKIKNI